MQNGGTRAGVFRIRIRRKLQNEAYPAFQFRWTTAIPLFCLSKLVEEVTNRNLPALRWLFYGSCWLQAESSTRTSGRGRPIPFTFAFLFLAQVICNVWLAILAYSAAKRQLPPRSCVHMGIGPVAQGSKSPGPVAKHLSFDSSTCVFFRWQMSQKAPRHAASCKTSKAP